MTSVRLGVIGCGKVFSHIHANALRGVRGIKIVAVSDPVKQRREDAVRLHRHAAAFVEWQELLERPDVDAVLICSPSADHANCARQAFAKKKHVYLEKPIAINSQEAESVIDAWRAAGTVGMLGFNYRFHPLYIQARQLVSSGQLGNIVAIRSVFSSAGGWLHDWKRKRNSGGGVLLDLASHHIDLVHFVVNRRIIEVSAQLRSERSEQDTACLNMVLDSGTVTQSFFSLYGTQANRFEVYGRSASLMIDHYRTAFEIHPYNQSKRTWHFGRSFGWGWSRFKRIITHGEDPSYRAAFSHFVDAIGTGRRPTPDLSDGLRVLKLIEAAEHSAATGECQRVEGKISRSEVFR